MKKVIVIGSGFSGISAASFMAKAGYSVTVLEKHHGPGGRAGKFSTKGFTFDMGPSWYWMPEVFERYFNCFGRSVSDYYSLKRLDPSYRVVWNEGFSDIPADFEELKNLFESIEEGSSEMLVKFLKEAEYKYEVGINNLVHKPGISLTEFIDMDLIKGIFRLDVFSSMKKHVRKYFKNPRLIQLMEFPVLFLGALPSKIPALYSLMNYADIKLGTWYPSGGMFSIVEGMYKLAAELGVEFRFNSDVAKIESVNGAVNGVHAIINGEMEFINADIVIGAADYHFIENNMLLEKQRSYSENYWDKRVMAPSCLLYYVGLDKKIAGVRHHTLFFDVDFDRHGREIYHETAWPEDPLFYVCTPSVTDSSVAPEGCENLFFLIPVASGLQGDTEEIRNSYFERILDRFEKHYRRTIRENIIFKRSFSVSDFMNDFNAYKGNAYGLANTLFQTAMLKPSIKSKKLKNLYYTGQLTVPGPGVPPSLISGEVVAKEILKANKITV